MANELYDWMQSSPDQQQYALPTEAPVVFSEPPPKRIYMNMNGEGNSQTLPDVGQPIISDGGVFSRGSEVLAKELAAERQANNKIQMMEVPYDPWLSASFSKGTERGNKLFGTGSKERYQMWPEKVITSGATAAGNIMKEGTFAPGLRREDFTDIPDPSTLVGADNFAARTGGGSRTRAPVAWQPGDELIEKAQDMSALAGTGGLGGAGAEAGVALGAGPVLRPALKFEGKIYKAPVGGQHLDALTPEMYTAFQKKAMAGDDINHYEFGFMNHKGQFLDREKALDYAIKEGMVDEHAGKYGALTSTLLADSSKPGAALEAMAKTNAPTFYSALEHNVGNISQNKMTGEQWLGTLSNKPGVKPEELQWTGLKDFLEENKGKPVTKEQINEHLASNKVELKEVSKGGETPNVKDYYNSQRSNNDPEWLQLSQHERAQWLTEAQKSGSETKYHSYQLPGGENYREMLMTLPSEMSKYNSFIKELRAKYGEGGLANKPLTEVERIKLDKLQETAGDDGAKAYKSSHWDEPNILAHVRMNDRTIDGKKSLHVEEIQSDWHQQGRDRGYKQPRDEKAIDALVKADTEARKAASALTEKAWKEASDGKATSVREFLDQGFDRHDLKKAQDYVDNHPERKAAYEKAQKTHEALNEVVDKSEKGVPDAPFKKTWHELALKRMLREAAEKGYDRLSWTPGEAQAARYDLSKQVDTIQATKLPDGTYNVHARPLNDAGFTSIGERVPESKLAEIVGKDLAEKISKQNVDKASSYKGLDLKIGGEGMKGFYDKMIPQYLEKLGKEHGVKVKQLDMPTKKTYEVVDKNGKVLNDGFGTEKAANDWAMHNNRGSVRQGRAETEPVHYIDIPQSLKDTALGKGFPLFAKGLPMPLIPVDHDPWELK